MLAILSAKSRSASRFGSSEGTCRKGQRPNSRTSKNNCCTLCASPERRCEASTASSSWTAARGRDSASNPTGQESLCLPKLQDIKQQVLHSLCYFFVRSACAQGFQLRPCVGLKSDQFLANPFGQVVLLSLRVVGALFLILGKRCGSRTSLSTSRPNAGRDACNMPSSIADCRHGTDWLEQDVLATTKHHPVMLPAQLPVLFVLL